MGSGMKQVPISIMREVSKPVNGMIAPTLHNNHNKLLGLEVIRFVSALSVLVWHYQHFFYRADKPTDFVREHQPLYSFFGFFYDYGYNGVQVFWCISGFIFFWKYRYAIAEKIINAKSFFVLRFSRLYPLHLVTLLLVALLQSIYFFYKNFYFVYQNNNVKHFLLQLFLASSWGFEKGASFNGPIWSISVEILIYLFFFIILRYIGSSLFINITIVFLCVIAKLADFSNSIFDCLAFFYVGGLSAIALQYFEKTKYQNVLRAFTLCFVVLFPLVVFIDNMYQNQYFAYFFLILYVPNLLYLGAQNVAVHPVMQKIIEAVGNMTYSSYLIHFPLQLIIALYCLWTQQAIPRHSTLFFAGFMLGTLVVSYYVYRFFEMPVQASIRKRFR